MHPERLGCRIFSRVGSRLTQEFTAPENRRHADRPTRLFRRHPDHPFAVHPAGAAVRLCARRTQLHALDPADARGHGRDVRNRRDPRRGRWRLGSSRERRRPLGSAGIARSLRDRAHLPASLRPDDPPVGRARLAADRTGRPEGERLVLGRAGCGHRPVVGALRRADPRPHLHRCRTAGGELQHYAPAAGLCARRGDFACPRAADRRQGFHANEEVARRQRANPPAARRARTCRRRRDRVRARHARPVETVERADRRPGEQPGRQARRDPRDGREPGSNRRDGSARAALKAPSLRSTASAPGSTARRSTSNSSRARSY